MNDRPVWRKSSYSGTDNGNCVEVRHDRSAVRDSKDPEGRVLPGSVVSLLAWVKAC